MLNPIIRLGWSQNRWGGWIRATPRGSGAPALVQQPPGLWQPASVIKENRGSAFSCRYAHTADALCQLPGQSPLPRLPPSSPIFAATPTALTSAVALELLPLAFGVVQRRPTSALPLPPVEFSMRATVPAVTKTCPVARTHFFRSV